MKHYLLWVGAFFLTIAPMVAQASGTQRCSGEILDLARNALHINVEASIRASTCHSRGKMILVGIALNAPGSTPNNPLDLPFYLAVFNARTHSLVASNIGSLPDGGGEEVGADSIKVEEPYFKLARNVSVFSMLVTQHSTVRCGEGGSDGQLSLFIIDGKQLVPIFSEPLTTHYYEYVGGLPCQTVHYSTKVITLSLSVAKTRSNGFYDLLITRTKTGRPTKTFRLQYNGRNYPVQELRGKLGLY